MANNSFNRTFAMIVAALVVGIFVSMSTPTHGTEIHSSSNLNSERFVHRETSSAASRALKSDKSGKSEKSTPAPNPSSDSSETRQDGKASKTGKETKTPKSTKAPKTPKTPKTPKKKKAPKKTKKLKGTPSPTATPSTSTAAIDIVLWFGSPVPTEVEAAQALKATTVAALNGDLSRRKLQVSINVDGVCVARGSSSSGTFDCTLLVQGLSEEVQEAVDELVAVVEADLEARLQSEIASITGTSVTVIEIGPLTVTVTIDSLSPTASPTLVEDDDAISNSTLIDIDRRLVDFETDCTCDDNDIISCTAPFAELECSCEDGDIICEDSSSSFR